MLLSLLAYTYISPRIAKRTRQEPQSPAAAEARGLPVALTTVNAAFAPVDISISALLRQNSVTVVGSNHQTYLIPMEERQTSEIATVVGTDNEPYAVPMDEGHTTILYAEVDEDELPDAGMQHSPMAGEDGYVVDAFMDGSQMIQQPLKQQPPVVGECGYVLDAFVNRLQATHATNYAATADLTVAMLYEADGSAAPENTSIA